MSASKGLCLGHIGYQLGALVNEWSLIVGVERTPRVSLRRYIVASTQLYYTRTFNYKMA